MIADLNAYPTAVCPGCGQVLGPYASLNPGDVIICEPGPHGCGAVSQVNKKGALVKKEQR